MNFVNLTFKCFNNFVLTSQFNFKHTKVTNFVFIFIFFWISCFEVLCNFISWELFIVWGTLKQNGLFLKYALLTQFEHAWDISKWFPIFLMSYFCYKLSFPLKIKKYFSKKLQQKKFWVPSKNPRKKIKKFLVKEFMK